MTGDPLRQRLADLVSAVIEVPVLEVDEALNFETAEKWDSVRHLHLVLAVEDAFGVTFDERQIAELTSFAALLGAIEALKGR